MNIAVIDVAAESGGALSILNDFCEELNKLETNDHWYIITSVVEIKETKYLHNIKIPQIKYSWFCRFFWEKFCFINLMKKLKIDIVVSLQNNALPKGKWKQAVYFHNILLLKHNISFSFLKSEERIFYIYSKILGPYIRHTWKNADKLYVQTKSIKEKIKKSGFLYDIEVISPEISLENISKLDGNRIKGYIYPASANSYKNHMAIIKAVEKINKNGGNVEVLFTIDGSENEYALKMVNAAKKVCGIRCIGKLTRNELFHYYQEYGVIMVSKIESFGMPLLEAKAFQTVVVAIDYPYARELLKGYNRAYLVGEDKLAQGIIEGLKDSHRGNYVENKLNSWKKMIESITRLKKE